MFNRAVRYLSAYQKRNPTINKILSSIYYVLKNNRTHVKGKNNIISRDESYFSNVRINIFGDNNQILIGKNTKLSDVKFDIYGDNHLITIEENSKISGNFWLEDNECQVSIGKNTTFENVRIAVTEPSSKILIGEDCMFSYNIEIRNGDSHSIIDLATNKRINYAKNVNIGNHVWIGANSVILKGVEIGDNCIVSTGAIVTKNVPAKCLIAGVPAKIIKDNISWDRTRIYT